MDDVRFGHALRAIRVRRRLRQSDLAGLAGVSPATISRLERGHIRHLSIETVRQVAAALDVRTELTPRWRGGELERLVAARHAVLGSEVAAHMEPSGWLVRPEVTFSIYGERGAIDLLAWHPGSTLDAHRMAAGRGGVPTPAKAQPIGPAPTGSSPIRSAPIGSAPIGSAPIGSAPIGSAPILLVVELKTEIVDVSELLATLHRKTRLAPQIARDLGWPPGEVATCLIVAEGRTNRRRVQANAALLRAALPDDGRRFHRWLAAPVGSVSALAFWPNLHPGTRRHRLAPIQRVRRPVPPIRRG